MEELSANNLEVPKICFNLDDRLGSIYEEMHTRNESDDDLDGDKRYKIKERIAQGGLKDIFKAFDLKSSRHVAMAFLREELDLEESLSSFIREAKITALLEHPNIIPVYDVGEEEKPFFTMKLIQGEDLSHFLFRKPDKLTGNEYLRIFLKVCDAIAYAHSRGVVHLDLKPENIRIDAYGEVLVHDWGLAKRIFIPDGDKNELIKDSAEVPDYIQGTPSYMAPEQFDPSQVDDERTDIFSLGGLLYSILTFKAPFSSEIDLAKREFTPLSQLSAALPESLSAVVDKSLQEKPDERYQTVSEMKNDIERYLDGFATSAESAGFFKQLNLLIKRNRKICFTIMAALIVIIILVSVFVSKIKQSESETKQALEQTKSAQAKAENALLEAQKNFDLFLREKENTKEISDVTSSSLSMADILPGRSSYVSTMNQLITALKVSPGNKTIHKKKLLFHLFNEEFQKAVDEFEFTDKPEYIASAVKVIPKYVSLKKNRSRLSDQDFVRLISDLKSVGSNWIAYVLCVSRVPFVNGRENQLKMIKNIFKVTNKNGRFMNFTYTTEDGVIFTYFGLRGTVKVFNYSALGGRYISTLDISNSQEIHIQELALTYIKKLNIYNVRVRGIERLKRVAGLEEIVVKKGQLTDKEKGSLKFLKITELD